MLKIELQSKMSLFTETNFSVILKIASKGVQTITEMIQRIIEFQNVFPHIVKHNHIEEN